MSTKSPASILFDIDGNEIQTTYEGDAGQVSVKDEEVRGVLAQILVELRKMNMYLSHMTDSHIEDEDVE